MKKVLLALCLFSLGSCVGGFLAVKFWERHATIRTEHVSHFCSCVADNPTYVTMMQIADNESNSLIQSKTKQFLLAHGLDEADFAAHLIPTGNGNFSLTIWSSNRTEKIVKLADEYSLLVHGCLSPHDRFLDEAHKPSEDYMTKKEPALAPFLKPRIDLPEIYKPQRFDDILPSDAPPCKGQHLELENDQR